MGGTGATAPVSVTTCPAGELPTAGTVVIEAAAQEAAPALVGAVPEAT
jgi:hypothetical protein